MANKIVITGWVAGEPSLTKNAANNTLLKFSIIEEHRWTGKEKQSKSKSLTHRVIMWGPMAEALQVKKGDLVCVDGMLEYHEFEGTDYRGKQTIAQVNARQIEVLHRPNTFSSPSE